MRSSHSQYISVIVQLAAANQRTLTGTNTSLVPMRTPVRRTNYRLAGSTLVLALNGTSRAFCVKRSYRRRRAVQINLGVRLTGIRSLFYFNDFGRLQ